QGIGREALWHLRHQDRQCVSQVGLLGSGSPVPPQQSSGPKVSDPLREKTWQGQSVDRLGPQARPGGLSEIGLRTPGVNPGVKARSRRLQVFLRRFCYHVGMKIKLSAHGAYHHQYHVVWIPKYRKKVLKGELKQYLEKGLFDITTFHPDIEI